MADAVAKFSVRPAAPYLMDGCGGPGVFWGCCKSTSVSGQTKACSQQGSLPYKWTSSWHFGHCSSSVIYGFVALCEARYLWILGAFLLPSLMEIAALLFSVQQPAGHLPAICVSLPPTVTRGDVTGSVGWWLQLTAGPSAHSKHSPDEW